MKVTFNDTETKRILREFAAVNYNGIQKAKTTKGAIRKQEACINRYAKKINGWVLGKIENSYNSKITKK